MFTGILRFEWRIQVRRPAFVAVATLFAAVGFALAATGFGAGGDVPVNAPWAIALSLALTSLLVVVAATLFCAQGALRDIESQMTEVVYTTAVTPRHYVLGRFAGVVAATATAYLWTVPGMLAGTFAWRHDAGAVGVFHPFAYLWPTVLLALPNVVLVCALLFAVALASRSSIATYVAGIFAYGLYFVTALFAGSPLMAGTSPPTARGMAIAAVVDPFGLSALFAQTRYWTVAERDARLLALDGPMAANRALWLLVTVVVLAVVVGRFAFRLPGERRRGARTAHVASGGAAVGEAARPGGAPPPLAGHGRPVRVPPAVGARAALRAFASVLRFELRHALRGWPFLGLLVAWTAMAAVQLSQTFTRGEFGTATLPSTGLVAGDLAESLAAFGLLLVVFFASEVVWRERAAGMAELVDATPVPSGALLAAKVAALSGLVAALAAVAGVSGMAYQVVAGWTWLEPELFAVAFFVHVGVPLLLVAVLAVVVQALVPNRHVGILVTALLVVWWHRGALGGPEHPLLRFAAAPSVPYSELSGFGPEAVSLAWFSAFWGAVALLLLALVSGLWRRGTETGLRRRLRALGGAGWSPGARRLAAAAAALCLGAGAAVFVQTNRWNVYRTADEVELWKATYERRYRHLAEAAQPTATDVRVEVDLRPEERRYSVRGSYRLENRTAQPINDLWVVTRRDLARVQLRAAGRPPVATDEAFGSHHFALSPPLEPGGRTTLDFFVEVARRGAVAGEHDHGIVGNGTFLLSTASLPSIGYRRSFELDDPSARRRQGLPARPPGAALEGADAAALAADAGAPVTFDATVSTAPDQVAFAPGTLVASGERHGRRFFRYRTEGAMAPFAAFASGRYVVRRRDHHGIALEAWFHPTHGRNVEAMLDAAAAALDYCSTAFGPYPHRELRLVEVPAATRFAGFAVPGTIFLTETRGFLTDRASPGRVDVVSKRVAHEVAHQWWGHQVAPATGPGATALVETLARYSELRVLAQLHGEESVPPVLAFELDNYLVGHARGDEPPLASVAHESHVYYAKGALVMAATRDLLGQAATDAALRRLVDDAHAGRQPGAAQLVAYLQAGASPRDRDLLEQWWRSVVLYDLGVTRATARATAGGRLALQVDLTATKRDARGNREVTLPVDEEIELAVYADEPGTAGEPAVPLHTGRYRLRGRERLMLAVDPRARWVMVDPKVLRIDRERADNLRWIERAPDGSGG
jgi:ABC-2 type transport system permease protein